MYIYRLIHFTLYVSSVVGVCVCVCVCVCGVCVCVLWVCVLNTQLINLAY